MLKVLLVKSYGRKRKSLPESKGMSTPGIFLARNSRLPVVEMVPGWKLTVRILLAGTWKASCCMSMIDAFFVMAYAGICAET
jgi:hypothetical protein